MHCFPRPTIPLRPTAPGSQPLLALPRPCSLQAPCADMDSCTRAHCKAGALDFTRLLCAMLGIMVIMAVPSIIKLQVHKSVCIDSSSLSFGIWKEVPVPFYISIYFFDISPKEILQGKKPLLWECRPCVYREFWHKSNITFNDNDTVSFLKYCNFQFQREVGLESYYIVKPNILVLSAALMMENKPMDLKLFMTLVFTNLVSVPSWTTL